MPSLHVPYSELTVTVGKRSIVLNKRLLDKQNCWGNLDKIKECHKYILTLYTVIDEQKNPETLKDIDKHITDLEFQLQDLWGFSRDARWHRFWERPKCTCPKMDNEDAYPSGRCIINTECPLHGGSNG